MFSLKTPIEEAREIVYNLQTEAMIHTATVPTFWRLEPTGIPFRLRALNALALELENERYDFDERYLDNDDLDFHGTNF